MNLFTKKKKCCLTVSLPGLILGKSVSGSKSLRVTWVASGVGQGRFRGSGGQWARDYGGDMPEKPANWDKNRGVCEGRSEIKMESKMGVGSG